MSHLGDNNQRILIVDDDTTFSAVLARALRQRGFTVDTVSRAESALQQASNHPYDSVLLDLMLDEKSSLKQLPALREALPDARLIVVTGYASIPTTVQAIKLGADDYLAKPIGVAEVIGALGLMPASASGDSIKPLPLRRLEWEHLQRVLADHNGNVSAAAEALGLHRRTLQRKLAKRPRADD